MDSQEDITQLLHALNEGDRSALDRLVPLVYNELSQIAHRELARRRPGYTLNTVALVHEAYLKLVDQPHAAWNDRTHFYAVAARAMRHILIDYFRKRQTQKRGGNRQVITLDVDMAVSEERVIQLFALDEALQRLEQFDDRLVRVLECRVFGGLTVPETAIALGVSTSTVDRSWRKAKAWLYQTIQSVE